MTFAQGAELLRRFVEAERSRLDHEDSHRLAFAFSQVDRYLTFMVLIADRCRESEVNFHDAEKARSEAEAAMWRREAVKLGPFVDRTTEAYWRIQLDVEAFYMFAKILLGRIANAVEFYFGQGRAASLASHDCLRKNLRAFANQKGLAVDAEFLETAERLQRDIVEFRDKQVEHQTNPRATRGLQYTQDGPVRVSCTSLFPTERDHQVNSKPVQDLEGDVTDYLRQTIVFLNANRDKARLKPAGQGVSLQGHDERPAELAGSDPPLPH
jgi:hypothetical protein